MTAAASSPPTLQSRSTIPTKQASSIVDSIETEVVLQTFQDKILVLVTQTSKIGSLTQVTLPASIPLLPLFSPATDTIPSLPIPHPSIALFPLLGTAPTTNDQPLLAMYATQIAMIVWAAEGEGSSRRPVVVGMGLKKGKGEEQGMGWDWEKQRFGKVMEMVKGFF